MSFEYQPEGRVPFSGSYVLTSSARQTTCPDFERWRWEVKIRSGKKHKEGQLHFGHPNVVVFHNRHLINVLSRMENKFAIFHYSKICWHTDDINRDGKVDKIEVATSSPPQQKLHHLPFMPLYRQAHLKRPSIFATIRMANLRTRQNW